MDLPDKMFNSLVGKTKDAVDEEEILCDKYCPFSLTLSRVRCDLLYSKHARVMKLFRGNNFFVSYQKQGTKERLMASVKSRGNPGKSLTTLHRS